MDFIVTGFKGLVLIKHSVYSDERGVFKELFRLKDMEKFLGYKINFCQNNSVLSYKNVLRGLHYQEQTFAQSKLVSVSKGKILDIAVDIRKDSLTYGKYYSTIISENNHKSLFIPKGFAHGYLTLSKEAIINYKVDNYYNSQMERIIKYNDELLNIDWGIKSSKLIISEKDKNQHTHNWE